METSAETPAEIQVESQPESPVLHRLEVDVAEARVRTAFDRAYRDLAKRVTVRGFRPGKAPRSVLERLYGASVAEQIEQALVAETLAEAVERSGLEPVAEPSIEARPPQPGEAFRYTARVEVLPAIELPDLAGLPARRPRVEVGDEDVDRELEDLRQRHAQLLEEPEDTPLAPGHVATIDFVGRIDGRAFEGGSGQAVEVEIGSGRFVPGFEEQLVGAVAGEDRELEVDFPEDYGNEQLAGKRARFAVHVATVRRRVVPELDDEFAKDLGEFETLAALRSRIEEDLASAREGESRATFHRSLVDSLIERAPFDVPPGMIDRELDHRLRTAHDQLAEQVPHEALHEQLGRWREQWRGEAEREVRERLLLAAVADQEAFEISPEDLEARVVEMAERQGATPERLRKAVGAEALERALQRQLRAEKALEFLGARAKVEETTDT